MTKLDDLLEKATDRALLTEEELVYLLHFPSDSPESFRVMEEANRLSRELSDGKDEVHAQLASISAPMALFLAYAAGATSETPSPVFSTT